VKQWKKNRPRHVEEENDGFEKMLSKSSLLPTQSSTKRKRENETTADQRRMNKKRDAKNKKYGFGGKKKYAKSNTKASTNDFKSPQFMKKKSRTTITNNSNTKRPGKTARANKKSKRNQ
jgi:rRNA-processing protein EBP2